MSNKKRASLLVLTLVIISLLSFSVFSTSFIIRKEYKNQGYRKSRRLENEVLEEEEEIKTRYLSYIDKKIIDKNLNSREEYILRIGKDEVWEKSYGGISPKTDSGYEIINIIRMEEGSQKIIYEKGVTKNNNYYDLIKNFSKYNENLVKIKLIKNLEVKIEDVKTYEVEITYWVELRYIYYKDERGLVLKKRKGEDMNVKVIREEV